VQHVGPGGAGDVGHGDFGRFQTNTPRNGTVMAALLIGSLAIGGPIFLIREMDRPVGGVMRISSWPVNKVLASMNW
jgi:hypothetical protein